MELVIRPCSGGLRRQRGALQLGLFAVAASMLLSGCGSTHIYSKTRDAQATSAKEAFDKLALQKGIDTERANLDKLLTAELAMQDSLARGVRDFQLRAMAEKSTRDGLVGPIEARIGQLGGSVQALEAANAFVVKQSELDENLARYKRLLTPYGVAVPSCNEMDKLAPGKFPVDIDAWLAKQPDAIARSTVRQTVSLDLRDYCTAVRNRPGAAYAALVGEIGAAWSRYQSDLAALNVKKAAVKELKDAYSAARIELDNAIAAGDSEPENREAVKKAVEKVQTALTALKGVGDNPFLDEFLAEKRIESIESFLNAVSEYQQGQKLPDSAGKAAMLATFLPGLVDDTRATLRRANKPLATPYVLARNYHQLNLEAANRDIAASEAIVRHSKEIADVLFVQGQQLLLAYKELHAPIGPNGLSVASKYAGTPFMDALKSASPREKQQLYSATTRYLDALKRLDGKRYMLEYLRVADFHTRSLAYAEINTRQWESLIGTSVTQLQEYGSGGLKPEQFAAFFNALMLFGIAWGVN